MASWDDPEGGGITTKGKISAICRSRSWRRSRFILTRELLLVVFAFATYKETQVTDPILNSRSKTG